MDAVREDMQVVEDTDSRLKWKAVSRYGNPWKGTSPMEKRRRILKTFNIKQSIYKIFVL